MNNENTNKYTKKNRFLVLIIIIILLLYLLIQFLGEIEHHGPLVPTGNVDIFEIICKCRDCKTDDQLTSNNNISENINENNNESEKYIKDTSSAIDDKNNANQDVLSEDDTNKNELNKNNIVVYDNYKIWDNKTLRIFSNPAYKYENIIAPGSANSYAFMIRNYNDFDVTVDICFQEENEKNINMQYKLTNEGNYIIGTNNNYETIKDKKIEQIKLPAKSYKSYILDWKWVDSDNDTEIGFDIMSNYKLTIFIGAN